MTSAQSELVHDLLRPEAYPWQPSGVELIETHISWVFLAGDRVVKIKRPVAFPFVDHTRLESRHQSCLDEVRLNRRLTDDVYLDVAPITRVTGRCCVGGEGEPIEWATLMRRLPAAGMLDGLLRRGEAPPDLAARLANRLVPFHRELAEICAGEPKVVAASVLRIVTENLDEIAPFAGTFVGAWQFDLVATSMRNFIETRSARFVERAAAGWVREGHGDLLAEHICLEPDGAVQIYDCVEFNRQVRCADVASDIAYLFMDLIRLGAGEVAAELLARYRAAGVDLPDELLRFYGGHRALVRVKIACLDRQGRGDGGATHRGLPASDYLDMASGATLTAGPVLVIMSGLSGTGKSTVARRLSRALGATIFTSDLVRKDLAGVSGPAPAAWGEGLYSSDWTRATYERLLTQAEAHLAGGHPVLLDATFLDSEQRAAAAALADRVGVPLVLVETVCDEAVVLARLAARAAEGDSPSDATIAIFRQQQAAVAAQPPAIPTGALALQIDTGGDPLQEFDALIGALTNAGIVAPAIPASPPG